mmetsp:Transcript_27797/g.54502  ORF Transcript_27797/g.54502 Transcript_27797/m.54502 type:complete len:574 (+) Transcript_27797:145-1866(+)
MMCTTLALISLSLGTLASGNQSVSDRFLSAFAAPSWHVPLWARDKGASSRLGSEIRRRQGSLEETSWSILSDSATESAPVSLAYVAEDLPLLQSTSRASGDPSPVSVSDLGKETGPPLNSVVKVRARLHTVRATGSSCFLVLREAGGPTVQAVHFKDKSALEESKALLKFVKGLHPESILEVEGKLVSATVKSCTQSNVEIQIHTLRVISRAPPVLPFSVEDAGRPEEEVEKSQDTDRPLPTLGQDLRLDYRHLDLRAPAQNAALRVKSEMCRLFREAMYEQGFTEIQTPKLIGGASEGGAEVFSLDYFGRKAFLAQSPQLFKQMAVAGDLGGVFEIGPVFRAEKSNSRRHLTEFTGVDMEMPIQSHYMEAIEVAHGAFKKMFRELEESPRSQELLARIRRQFPSEPPKIPDEPVVISHQEAVDMLRERGDTKIGDLDDFSSSQEILLGEIVREKYGTDLVVVDQYPLDVRPFYTMLSPSDPSRSNSYDIFLRGQEISSGAQRIHDPDLLLRRIQEKEGDPEELKFYIEALSCGCPPHAGFGLGLDRIVSLYLDLGNVRKASLFPRDPRRLSP